jgi:hypothetical protein
MPGRINRRDALKLALVGGVATMLQACGSRPSHGVISRRCLDSKRLCRSLPCFEPTRSDERGDYYEIEARESSALILPGKQTTIQGYNGIFPGPSWRVAGTPERDRESEARWRRCSRSRIASMCLHVPSVLTAKSGQEQ